MGTWAAAGACGGRAGGVCMYIYVYVINNYVYMYIPVCVRHRFSVNSAPKEEEEEEEEGLSASIVCWGSAPLSPCPLPRAAGFSPTLPAPSFLPALCPSVAMA